MNKNRIFTIVSIVILLLALVGLIIGYYMAGTNFLDYLQSKWAMYIYTGIAIWVVVAVVYIVKEKVSKL